MGCRAPQALASLLALACGDAAPERPNVLLITVDTLRADHLTPYGYERDTSPFLAELARTSFVFEDVVAQCGTTPQSLSSLMTGLYPFTDGILAQNGRFAFLRGENRTLAAALAEAGYETCAITSQIQCARVTGLDLGFQGFDGVELGEDRKQEPNRAADEMTDRALAWLKAREHPERPFFLWLHYLDPHHPYKPPARYEELWKEAEPEQEGATRRYRYDPKSSLDHPVSDGELARLTLAYDREIRFTDDELRRLFEQGVGDLARTLVIVSADHGEALGDHGMIGHNDLFQPILHVPLIVRLPGKEPRSGRIDAPVMLVDVVPTVLDLVDLAPRAALRGQSLLPLMERAGALEERLRLAEYPASQALYRADLKLMKRKNATLLFDLGRDGAETSDVSKREPEVVSALLAEAATLRAAPLFAPTGGEEEMPAVSPRMLEELEALGYGGGQ